MIGARQRLKVQPRVLDGRRCLMSKNLQNFNVAMRLGRLLLCAAHPAPSCRSAYWSSSSAEPAAYRRSARNRASHPSSMVRCSSNAVLNASTLPILPHSSTLLHREEVGFTDAISGHRAAHPTDACGEHMPLWTLRTHPAAGRPVSPGAAHWLSASHSSITTTTSKPGTLLHAIGNCLQHRHRIGAVLQHLPQFEYLVQLADTTAAS